MMNPTNLVVPPLLWARKKLRPGGNEGTQMRTPAKKFRVDGSSCSVRGDKVLDGSSHLSDPSKKTLEKNNDPLVTSSVSENLTQRGNGPRLRRNFRDRVYAHRRSLPERSPGNCAIASESARGVTTSSVLLHDGVQTHVQRDGCRDGNVMGATR